MRRYRTRLLGRKETDPGRPRASVDGARIPDAPVRSESLEELEIVDRVASHCVGSFHAERLGLAAKVRLMRPAIAEVGCSGHKGGSNL